MKSFTSATLVVLALMALTNTAWGMNNYTVISFWGNADCSGGSPLQTTYTLYPGACSSMPHECIASGSNEGVYESIGCEAVSLNPQQAAPGTAQSVEFSGGSCDSAADIQEATI